MKTRPALFNSVLYKNIYFSLLIVDAAFFMTHLQSVYAHVRGYMTGGGSFLQRPPLFSGNLQWVRSVSQWRVKLGVCSSLLFLSTAFSGKHLTPARFPRLCLVLLIYFFAPEPRRHHGRKKKKSLFARQDFNILLRIFRQVGLLLLLTFFHPCIN